MGTPPVEALPMGRRRWGRCQWGRLPFRYGYADLREFRSALTTASDIAFSLDAAPSGQETELLTDALRRRSPRPVR